MQKRPTFSSSLEKRFGILFVLKNRMWRRISKTTSVVLLVYTEESE